MKAGSWQLFLYHVILSLTITHWTCVAADPSLAGSSPFPGNLVRGPISLCDGNYTCDTRESWGTECLLPTQSREAEKLVCSPKTAHQRQIMERKDFLGPQSALLPSSGPADIPIGGFQRTLLCLSNKVLSSLQSLSWLRDLQPKEL